MINSKGPIFYVMGVSGSGKSTVGKLLATELNIPFFDGDDFHPESNIIKMKNGSPLNDDDRYEWLLTLNNLAKKHVKKGAVIVCSALKEKYRTLLSQDIINSTTYIYLEGSFNEISERLNSRKSHFMPSSLLQSQFNTLEVPKDAITIAIKNTPSEIISKIINEIKA